MGLCAYANSLDTFYPNTTINGVDVAGLTAEQAAERLRQEIPEETVEFYLPRADETGDGESAPEGDMLYDETPPPYLPTGSWASRRTWTMRPVPSGI